MENSLGRRLKCRMPISTCSAFLGMELCRVCRLI